MFYIVCICVIWMKFGYTSAMLSLSLPFTNLLWPHGIVKCPVRTHFRFAGSSRTSRYFSPTVLWTLWIQTYLSSNTVFHLLYSMEVVIIGHRACLALNSYLGKMPVFKGLVHFQNKKFLIIYSPPCHPRCSCLSFFSRKEIKVFEKNIPGLFSILWTSMGANVLKVQIEVSMQLQRALHDPSRGIRVLSNEMIGHFLKKKTKLFNHKCSCTSSTSRITESCWKGHVCCKR